MQLTLKGDQPAAIDAVMKWWKTPAAQRKQIFRLYGGAGVGKTTIAFLMKEVANVHFMTLSGKAALVMRKKGADGATTIHSAIYKPVELDNGEIDFEINYDSEMLSGVGLIVLDEIGMVGTTVGEDLVSFGIPILALGDLNQLPPPNSEPSYFTGAPADFTMYQVLRQAEDSPIIHLAYMALRGERIEPGKYGDCTVYGRKVKDSTVQRVMLEADQVLCGRNVTRVSNNHIMRGWKGLQGVEEAYLPVVGDRLVCLRNKHKKGILNGEQFDLVEILDRDLGRVAAFNARSLDSGSDRLIEFEAPWNWFNGSEQNLPSYERANFDQITYAYVMTVHKFQGSQADYVAILDESGAFKEHRKNHLYTAITRAAKKVDIFL